MKEDWTDFKKTFTQEQEDAIWQYFLDHSRIQPNGYVGIQFYIKDINDFWRRLHFRFTGDYVRYDKLEKEFRIEKYTAIKSQAGKGDLWDKYDTAFNKSWFRLIWKWQKIYLKHKLTKK